ncbi:MAG: hypothetical protein GX903_05435 [Spirochaetales bacterium]|nr:hypothetical protein [Spirochaetales bacterium]
MEKRIKKILLFLLVILSLAPLTATPNTPYDIAYCTSYKVMTAKERQLLDTLYEGVRLHLPSIKLPFETEEAVFDKVLNVLCDDFPEILSLDKAYSVYKNQDDKVVDFVPQYFISRDTEVKMQKLLFSVAVKIVSASPSTEGEKELYFHDQICNLVTYSKNLDRRIIHTSYGALVEKEAVCDGYAKAMALLCRLANIECSVVSGMSYNGDTTGFHAWNIMKIHNTYTFSDLTWNDFKEYIRYDYFNVTDDIMAVDHKTVSSLNWPSCKSLAVNWHYLNNLYIKAINDKELRRLVKNYARFSSKTNETISIRFEDYDTYLRFTTNFEEWFKLALKDYKGSFSYWISPNDRQQCFAVRKVD